MTTSKKKKSGVRVSYLYAPRACTVRLHRNDNWIGSSTNHPVLSVASLEPLGMLLESDNSFSDYIADQTDIQPNDPAEDNAEEKEKPKQRMRTTGKAMEEWLNYQDTYLQEMLHHDGREGLQITLCADCGSFGNFSCYDCAYCIHYCQDCLVNHHRLMPLHRIRVCKIILSIIWHVKLF